MLYLPSERVKPRIAAFKLAATHTAGGGEDDGSASLSHRLRSRLCEQEGTGDVHRYHSREVGGVDFLPDFRVMYAREMNQRTQSAELIAGSENGRFAGVGQNDTSKICAKQSLAPVTDTPSRPVANHGRMNSRFRLPHRSPSPRFVSFLVPIPDPLYKRNLSQNHATAR
jgi:hypothetical protein